VLKEEDVSFRYKAVTANPAMAKPKASRKATLLKDSVVNVEPADGWENYNTYVNNNIEIPDDILDKNLHGQVQLSFDIKPNGTITNIKVDKSLCNDCDEAAKRLIEQGPQWKTKNGKKGKGKVVVQF
jgi:TonB family protein